MFGIYRKKNPKVKPGKEGIGKHVIREEEVSAMSFMINNNFAETEIPEIAERIPIDPDSEDLFPQMADGLLLIHLTNKIDPEAIDLRSVNKYGPNMNAIAIGANINQALTAAKGYVKLVGINSQVFTHQNKGLVLATLTQMSRLIATGVIDLAHCEELYRLKFEDESIEDFNALKPEDILIRWVNHHLKEAGQERRIENLGKDIADSEAMTYVLSQLDKPPSNETEERLGRTNLNALQEEDLSKRGEECVEQSKLIGVKEVVRGKDLHKGNQKVNTLFVAEVFNTRHGLHPLTAEEKEKMGNDYKETEGSKEEKAFALWINSLQLENVQIERSLCRECADGIYLLKVCDFLTPGSVDWGKVYGTEPPMKLKPFDKKNGKLNNLENTENCVQAFDCCKSVLNSKMVGLGPSDIRDG